MIKPPSKPHFSVGDWEALCRFIYNQRWHRCPGHLMPERFRVMVAPETLDQRKAVKLIHHSVTEHGSGWRCNVNWRERLTELKNAEARHLADVQRQVERK